MNLDYDINLHDKQKLKIEKMFEDIENWVYEPKIEIKAPTPKKWNETFQDLVKTISSTDIIIKNELKQIIRDIKFNKKLP
jgi:hypothetical protein